VPGLHFPGWLYAHCYWRKSRPVTRQTLQIGRRHSWRKCQGLRCLDEKAGLPVAGIKYRYQSITHIDKKYVFNAAGLDWNVQWHGSDKVSVDFYDYGDGVSVYDARKTRAPSNHIATLTFQLDQQTHRFIEIKE
jgi:hypothetical protein